VRLRVEPRKAMMLNLWVQLEQEIALAERASGAAQSALDRLEQLLPSIRSAGIWQVARTRAQLLGQTVASLLAVAVTRPANARKALLRRAEALLAQSPAPKAWLAVHRASIAYQRGRTHQALRYLDTVAATTNTDEGWLLSLSARRTLGVLRADDRMIHDSESNLSAICTTADLRYLASLLVSGIPMLGGLAPTPSP
jgi:tetratricopeptide (TPR) repeat protein